jgi:hypothetical protein
LSHKCIVVRPGQPPVVEDLGDDLKEWQAMVGGDIEGWHFDGRIQLICNDSRQYLPLNRLAPRLGSIHGTFFLTKADDEGETTDLTDSDIERCLTELARWPMASVPQPSQAN